jgi:hypothetical protein
MSQHNLQAWTKEGDFVPTLYIEGEINTNGEKPVVNLVEAVPQGIVPQNLLLNFTIDVYDPSGNSRLAISNYSKSLSTEDEYSTITINAQKGDITLKVEKRKRD